jgi:hypothetical protein
MKLLRNAAIVVVIGFVMGAAFSCKGKSYVSQLADLEKKACACADKTCADAAFKDFMAVVEDMKKTEAKVSNEDGQKLGTSTASIVKCLMAKGVSPLTIQQEMQKFK